MSNSDADFGAGKVTGTQCGGEGGGMDTSDFDIADWLDHPIRQFGVTRITSPGTKPPSSMALQAGLGRQSTCPRARCTTRHVTPKTDSSLSHAIDARLSSKPLRRSVTGLLGPQARFRAHADTWSSLGARLDRVWLSQRLASPAGSSRSDLQSQLVRDESEPASQSA